ncbi:hypothetical protein NIES593_12560 [Hydrococcus rivularis NIES-593]|uniref:Uncharacterized protein n=1 Tax=Hydrococcus rivularis NIES-593 TaxID=1921803 RepID=A0A1U7HGB0_9CYAN|nr:hypothetical protein [Hydrococcus rivularis]OKH22617.1 hypothetical protein NIES593_12560 [Hydrococcus rivularis NIES-593]
MLKSVSRLKKEVFSLNILKKRNFIALISYLCPFALFISPATAVTARLGVVKAQENAAQWQEITKRLQATGVDYCIVDASKWRNETDLGGVRVLLLPNVDSLDWAQASALEVWMARGGRVIVTGPTGNLSLPEVRKQLRSLFGAYWGFSNSFPIALEVVGGQLVPTQPQAMSGDLVGGTLIPTKADSEAAAIWVTEERVPAVVFSNRAIYIGWRWGMEGVATPAFDTAWLEAALGRYGVTRQSNLSMLKRSEPAQCNEGNPLLPPQQEAPILRDRE